MNLKRKKIWLVLQLVIVVTCSVFAKHKEQYSRISDPSVTINVIILDSTILNAGSIEFLLYRNGINSEKSMQTDYYKYEIKNSITKLNIPLSTEINYGRIYYRSKNSITPSLDQNNNLFIFESTDNIEIYIDRNNTIFKGKGHEKYNCILEASKHHGMTKHQSYVSNSLFSKKDYFGGMSYLIECEDSLYQMKLKVIERCSTSVTNKVYKLMLADAWGSHNTNIIGIIFGPILEPGNGENINDAIERLFKVYLRNFESGIFSEKILAQSFQYCDFLLWKERKSQYFFKRRYHLPNSEISNVYYSIDNNYSGIIKDKLKLLTYYLGKTDNSDSTFNIANKELISKSTNIYMNAIIEYITKLKGAAFPFELPDRNEKIYKHKDFKGKLIVMDFWFTGCHGCLEMAKSLKPIILSLKNNSKIVFISLSTDGNKSKHLWLESLDNEKYSSKDEINLLVPNGNRSDIIKHYNIIAYPKLIIISKDGTLVSVAPPDPRKDPLKFKNFLLQYL